MLTQVLSFSIKLFDNVSSAAEHNIQDLVLHAYKYPLGPTLCCYSDKKLSATAEGPHNMPIRQFFPIIGAQLCQKKLI